MWYVNSPISPSEGKKGQPRSQDLPPFKIVYRHNVSDDNADAHMKHQNMGREVVIAITDGQLDFGTWERIF